MCNCGIYLKFEMVYLIQMYIIGLNFIVLIKKNCKKEKKLCCLCNKKKKKCD